MFAVGFVGEILHAGREQQAVQFARLVGAAEVPGGEASRGGSEQTRGHSVLIVDDACGQHLVPLFVRAGIAQLCPNLYFKRRYAR